MSRLIKILGICAFMLSPTKSEAQQVQRHVPAQISDEAKDIVGLLDSFAFDLFRIAREEDTNLFLSPFSVSAALALVYGGAANATKEEMAQVLQYPASLEKFESHFGELIETTRLDAGNRELAINNALWVQQDMAMREAYLNRMKQHYQSQIKPVDFASSPEAARQTINGWVSDATHDRIKDLLAPSMVDRATRTILVNTIYFKAQWSKVFSAAKTKEEPFHLASGQQVPVMMMHQKSRFQLAELDGVKAIRLPYQGGETEMLVFLPDRVDGLADFEASLTAKKYQKLSDKLAEAPMRLVLLAMPKFQSECKADLRPLLEQMGMTVSFSDDADFSGMLADTAPNEADTNYPLKIDSVVHQTFLEVQEQGTEAAAATAAIIKITAARREKEREPVIFRADHPFFYMIRDKRTKATYFLGRFAAPTA